MANRYWVGGTGTWVAGSTTNWSASSGGASGASVPTAADSVFFDQAGTYTVTLTGALTCLDFTVSAGTVTFSGTGTPTISGSISLLAGTVWSATGVITFNSNTFTNRTITTNGTAFTGSSGAASLTFLGAGGSGIYRLGSALTLSNGNITLTQGNFQTLGFAVTISNGSFIASSGAVSNISFVNSTISINGTTSPAININTNGLTFSATNSQINIISSTATGITVSGNLTFNNVAFTSTTLAAKTITQSVSTATTTYNNLSFVAASTVGVTNVTFVGNQTINGTLSTTGTAGNRRVFFSVLDYGIGWTLTCNSAASLTDADFRDIYVKGTAAPISGTRIGNRGNNSGITFSTPKTVYWNLGGTQNWNADGWAATSGAAVNTNNFPLPQDTAVFDNSFAAGTTVNINGNYVGSVNSSTRTTALTVGITSAAICYGNWNNGSGFTFAFSLNSLTFSGGSTQTITPNGKQFGSIFIDTYGGTVQLAGALNVGGNTLTVTNGTFDTAGYAFSGSQISSTVGNVRTISFGASTVTLNATSIALFFSTTINLTFNSGTSSIVFTSNSATINASGQTFYNVSFTNTGASNWTITGGYTFNNLTFTSPSAGITNVLLDSNQTINGTLTCAGASAVRRLFLQSSTIGTQRTLTAAAISATDCDFRDIVLAGAAAGASPTRAGDCGNNSGITFPAPKTVYWNLAGTQNWSATGWCTGSGGTPDINQFPLAQDTAVFDNTGSAGTVTINAVWNIGTFDASLRTSAMTLTIGAGNVYGDWKFGTGVTSSSNVTAIVFCKNGTQTITSNGVQFGVPVTINNPNAYVQLADALSLNSALTLTTGTFDAVTYNVITVLFTNSATANTLKMGSGTWTLFGTGTVWAMNSVPTLIAGTSTIVLSNTSAINRTFSGGGLYYNKLTIGGATGSAILLIAGNNTFGELASTKTVAFNINMGTGTTQTVGKWAISGTAGNLFTIRTNLAGSAFTLIISGPANSGIDYLSIQDCSVSATSPGEFYVGANSINVSNNTRVIFTATPTPRNLFWVGGTGNWSSTTKWATSSGGASGAAIPTSLDSVTFDSASNATAYTATIDAGVTIARCAAFTMAGPASGNVTWAGTVLIAFHGNVSFAATGITRTYTGVMNWAGNASYTFTTNGLALANSTTVNGIGSTWTLGSSYSNSSGGAISVTFGTFNTSASNYSVTIGQLFSASTGVRVISLNGSTLTGSSGSVQFTTTTNLTFNAGTSTINHGGSGFSLPGGGVTFYNFNFTAVGTSSTTGISGANTFNNLSFPNITTVGIMAVTFFANQTINGTLTLGAGTAAAYRTFLASDTINTTRTLTVNALAAGAADIDFRDITIAGAAAPISGTRFGNAKGNNGITFPAAKTVYWALAGSNSWGTASAGSWSATSGGSAAADQFPLAQDTAYIPFAIPTSGSTITVNANYNIGTLDMNERNGSALLTLATGTTTPQIYVNWINGTGTTLSGTGIMTFAGRASQTITSAGKTFTQPITVNSFGGSVTLQDSINCSFSGSAAIQLTAGTFNANNYNVTLSGAFSGFTSTGSNTRTLGLGSGTWTVAGGLTPWNVSGLNLTITGTATISMTNASNKTFQSSLIYSGVTLNQGGLGILTINGNPTFANISDTAVGAATINLGGNTVTVGAFTASGTAGNLLTITGSAPTNPATLIYSGSGAITGLDYLVPTSIRAYPTTGTWYAGNNSINGGSLGWNFSAPVIYNVFIVESNRASDVTSAAFGTIVYDSSIAESSQASDSISAREILFPAISEQARASETNATKVTFLASVSDTARPTDSVSSKATFGSSTSEQARATDSVAAQETLFPAISEQAQAADSISAREILFPAISEQARASETASATQSFGALVSNTANASQTNSATAAFSGAVTATINVSDASSAKQVFGSFVSNTVTVADSAAAKQTFKTNISDTVNASDAVAADKGLRSSIIEQANAADSVVSKAVFQSAVSDTARATDSITPTLSMGVSISESATAVDTISAQRAFNSFVSNTATVVDSASAAQQFRTAIAESSQAANIFSAIQGFKSNIAETARASETNAAKASFGSAVSNTARASDTTSSKAVFGSAVNNAVQISDSSVGFIRFPGSIAESVQVRDQDSAKATFSPRITESARVQDISAVAASTFNAAAADTARALDSTSSSQAFGSNVANTVRVSDSPSAKASFGGSVSEAATALDSVRSNAAFGSQVSNSVQVSDALSAAASFGANFSATVQAQDSALGAIQYNASSIETARTSETTSSLPVYATNVAESATANSTAATQAIFQGIIDEVVRGSDQFSTSVVFLAAFSEFARAYAESVGYLTGSSSVSESSTAADTTAATKTLPGNISESATGADQSAAALIWAVYISEQAAGLDSLNAPGSTYNATVANTVRALDTPSTNAIFYAAVIAYAGITDIATARYLWELIDDSQTADWNTINDDQTSTWTLVNDAQINNWAIVNNAQTQIGNSYGAYFFRSVATSETNTVVIGSAPAGNLLSSSASLVAWDQTFDGSVNNLNNIIYAQGRFYAFGAGLKYSIDGLTWTTLTNPFSTQTNTTFYALAVSPTMMVAVGGNFGAYSSVSTDGGVTWTLSGSVLGTNFNRQNLIWNGTAFVLGRGGGVYRSTNGLTWTRPVILGGGSSRIADIAWNGSNKYVYIFWDAFGIGTFGAYTSSDGVTWTSRSYSREYTSVFWDGTQFVYVNFTYSIYINNGDATAPVLVGAISGYRSPVNNYPLYKPLKLNGVYIWPGQQIDTTKYYFYTSTNFSTFSPSVYNFPFIDVSNTQTPGWTSIETT